MIYVWIHTTFDTAHSRQQLILNLHLGIRKLEADVFFSCSNAATWWGTLLSLFIHEDASLRHLFYWRWEHPRNEDFAIRERGRKN